MLLQEVKKFSKDNWWVYLLLIFSLIIVWISWKGNLVEILILFVANFFANLSIMVMQSHYTAKNNKTWSFYQLLSVTIFTTIAIYWLLVLNQSQYIIWQICYILAALKTFSFYNFWKNFKYINAFSLWVLNIILLSIFIWFSETNISLFWLDIYFTASIWAVIMWLGFSFVTTWLVSISHNLEYWFNLIWISLIVYWSGLLIFTWFNNWNINWIELGYFILTSTVLVYYLKIIKKYL